MNSFLVKRWLHSVSPLRLRSICNGTRTHHMLEQPHSPLCCKLGGVAQSFSCSGVFTFPHSGLEYLAWARGRSLLSQDVTPAALRVTYSPWLLQSNLWVRKDYAVGNHEVAQICHKSLYVFLFTYNRLADTLRNGIPILSKGSVVRSALWTLDKWPPLWASFVPSVGIPYQDSLWKSMWKCFIKKQKERN